MKTKTILPLLIFLFFGALNSEAQKKKELPPSTFSLNIPYDNMFGLYPSANGSFGIKENLSFTYYGDPVDEPKFRLAGHWHGQLAGDRVWVEHDDQK